MSDETTKVVTPESPFVAIMAKTGQPEPVTKALTDKLTGLFNLITRHNSRVIRIQQTKATDPNNEETLDGIRRTQPELAAENAEFEAVAEQYETMLAALREKAKAFVKPPLSQEEMEAERKAANEEAKLISDEMVSTKAFATMADTMLGVAGASIDGGVFGLMPNVESIKNVRGRKTAGASGTPIYRTRFDAVSIDGIPAEKSRKKGDDTITESNLIIAAEVLNAKWNADKFPENEVTDEELERAMYASQGKDFRDKEGMAAVFEFEFTKTIKVQNPNDDSTKDVPETVKFGIIRNMRVAGAAAEAKAKSESTDEKPADAKADEKASEPKKDSAPAADNATKAANVPAPNSKAALAAAKKDAAK